MNFCKNTLSLIVYLKLFHQPCDKPPCSLDAFRNKQKRAKEKVIIKLYKHVCLAAKDLKNARIFAQFLRSSS